MIILLYSALNDIKTVLPAGLSLAAMNAATILADAKAATPDALASRYALVNGNPFVVKGADYSTHNANGELELFNTADHSGSLTDQYLADRAAYLKWTLQANTQDKSVLLGDKGPQNTLYEDLARHTTLTVNGGLLASTAPARQIIFGSDAADSGNGALTGGDQADALYGMGGNDMRNKLRRYEASNDQSMRKVA